MSKVNLTKSSFSGGELSPLLHARTDVEIYTKGVETLENFIVMPQGVITRRPGTMFVKEVKDSSKITRLIPFQFSTVQAYVLEMGDLYFRFYKNNGVITETAKTITAITAANPGVVTSVAHGFLNGEEVYISAVGGMTELNGRFFIVANKTADTFELSGENTSTYTTYTSGGTASRVYTIVSPFAEADINQVNFAQSADTLFMVHPDYPPQNLIRTSDTSWAFSAVTFKEPPYLPENITEVKLAPDAVTGTGIAMRSYGGNAFTADDVGKYIWTIVGVTRGYALVTAYVSPAQVTVDIKKDFLGSSGVTRWSISAFSAGNGYPSVVTLYENRLLFANTESNPQTIWGSVADQYNNFGGSDSLDLDTDTINYTIGSDRVNSIQWLSPNRTLLLGTNGEEFNMSASSQNEAITPTNVKIYPEGNEGSAALQPVRVGSDTLYIQATQRKVMAISYDFNSDRNLSSDLTIFAEHLGYTGTITSLAYQRQPYRAIWGIRSDGVLLGCTYIREQTFLAWHRHELGGTATKVKSIAVIDGVSEDQLWMIVSRTINGGTKQYIEYMTPAFRNTAIEDAHFADSGLKYDGVAITVVHGLRHLIGQSVTILADGATHPNKTVSATGTITLDRSATTVIVGLGYESNMRTLIIDAPTQIGSSQSSKGRVHEIGVRVFETIGLKYGQNFNELFELPFRTPSMPMNMPVELFTGVKTIKFNYGSTTDLQIALSQTQPLPMTILAITAKMKVEETR